MYSGINVEDDDKYKGVYEWKRVDTSTSNLDAASLSFTNWVPGKTISLESVTFLRGGGIKVKRTLFVQRKNFHRCDPTSPLTKLVKIFLVF